MSRANPFLVNMPVVQIVSVVRTSPTGPVETPLEKCPRVWGRISVHATSGDMVPSIESPDGKRLLPTMTGINKMRPY